MKIGRKWVTRVSEDFELPRDDVERWMFQHHSDSCHCRAREPVMRVVFSHTELSLMCNRCYVIYLRGDDHIEWNESGPSRMPLTNLFYRYKKRWNPSGRYNAAAKNRIAAQKAKDSQKPVPVDWDSLKDA